MNYTVRAKDGTFLMTAPLMVIAAAFGIHPQGIRRIEQETEECLGVCELHFNGRSPMLNLDSIRVSRH